MPKLLQINTVVNTGSTGRIVEQIGEFVTKNGWDSHIAYGRTAGHSQSSLTKIGSNCDQRIHGIQTRVFDRHGLASIKSTKKLIDEIEILKPDIIHIHNIHGYYLNYQVLFKYFSGFKTPIVWTLHDCWAFTGHCTHFSDINCLKWQSHCLKCPKTKNYPSSFLIDNSYNNFELKRDSFTRIPNLTLVTVSKWLSSMVKLSFLRNHNIQVIHNGINIEDFFPIDDTSNIEERYDLKNRKVLLAVATSWSKNKGWEDYMTLAEIIPSDYVIVMVGITKKQKHNLPAKIIGIERTESVQELAALYSRADVLLNLSYQETFGMTTVEGFACGTPAVVYNATASPELLTNETGIIVEPGDIYGVLNAVMNIISKGKKHYASHCRQLAIERFNKEDRYQDYYKLYSSLIANRNHP